MTGMPVFNEITLYQGTPDERKVKPYDGCKLVTEEFGTRKVQDAEKHNNNLHIWELAEGLRSLQEYRGDLDYRVLAPKEIASLYKDSPSGARSSLDLDNGANVIAALNGPMAHIYLRSSSGWRNPLGEDDQSSLRDFAEVLRILYQSESPQEALDAFGIDESDYFMLLDESVGRLKGSIDRILIREGGVYKEFKGYGSSQVTSDISLSDAYIQYRARIEGLNNPDRSGDIILIMRDKTEEHESQRFTCGVACKAWHGGLNPGDSYVPFILAYPGGNAVEVERLREGIGNCPEDGSYCEECACGNWKVTGVIMQVIQKQYGQ